MKPSNPAFLSALAARLFRCTSALGRFPRRQLGVRSATLLALGLCLGALPSMPAFAQLSLVPYGSIGYRYSFVTGDFHPGAKTAELDDRAFDVGAAPFGEPDQARPISPVTDWPGSTNLIAQHSTLSHITIGGTLHKAIDNDVTIYYVWCQLKLKYRH